jgi:DNA-binding NarL/FixJ family response regulator
VILDLTIPGGMGGLETFKGMLAQDPRTKAIVSSGYADDPVLANFQNFGFRGVIIKPYRITELSEVLHRVINRPEQITTIKKVQAMGDGGPHFQ